ncbi:gliding motility-associated ABC transporter ATP-binding subunit GldA [Draconibacterium sp. IB214405]|uniref:gliding motility-associated ABC transporter ATP-binding subunit GldA n=1 Tax=Draconibacterium sp. IB214405 TaxID=3097352 RepID=UPI002A0DD39D|nr:gliding motility-associated ABC transporter ATP-binding subunit GldA [Draconibacterium sp. IB214405]MDX8337693.1 gliding motility-associated ABC transporter ATP-binding subunit GldA [Draconibacterium sp. IB214405]
MIVETRNITKLFGKQKALDAISFTVNKGELVGFLGPNGAGKSTTMKIITGFLPQDEGDILIDGAKVSAQNLEYKKQIGYLPEHNPLYTDLYVKEFLEVTAGFYHLKNKKQRIAEMIELTGLGLEQHKKIRALSKGYRQRVGLAQALIHDPSILILDEPTTGLDPNQLEEIRALIREISKEKTVILSSHIMQEVEAVCNRVLIINKGKIVADGDISAVKAGINIQNQVVVAEFKEQVSENQLLQIPGIKSANKMESGWEIEAGNETDIRQSIFQFAVDKKLTLLTLFEKQQNLENVFHQLTR